MKAGDYLIARLHAEAKERIERRWKCLVRLRNTKPLIILDEEYNIEN